MTIPKNQRKNVYSILEEYDGSNLDLIKTKIKQTIGNEYEIELNEGSVFVNKKPLEEDDDQLELL